MSFLAPIAFAFAATIPVVVAFYLLKRRRVIKLTSSTVLWQRFLAESQANAPFQRLKKNWLLLLQLLLLSLLVLGLARPYFSGSAKPTRLRVLVLDASASMKSTDEHPSRFERAKSEAAKWIAGLREGEQMMLLSAGAVTEVKQSPTSDAQSLRRALDACQPSEGRTRLAEALQTASAFTYEQSGETLTVSGEIHLFSDGAAVDLDTLANKNLPVIYHRIGQRGNNVGIVSLDVRANPDNAAERAVFVGVSNFSTNPVSAQLSLRFNDQVMEVKSMELPATNSLPLVFIAQQEVDGIYQVNLTVSDDLDVDNQASIFSVLPRPLTVLLVTRGNRFLEKGLRGVASARVTVASQLADRADGYDVVVLDDVVPEVWPKVNTLAIRVAPTNWFEEVSIEATPAIVDWNHTHPLLRSVNFDNVDVAESILPKLPPWSVALVQSQRRPMIIAGEREQHRIVWLGFDPLRSNWPLRISFPIFLANALEWLNPSLSRAADLSVHPGEPLRYVPAQAPSKVEVTRPDGRVVPLPVGPGTHEILFGDTSKQGVYRLKSDTNELTFCVNLLDAAESNISPRDELPLGKYATVLASRTQAASHEVWRWLASAGLIVLMIEWWYFHRRTV